MTRMAGAMTRRRFAAATAMAFGALARTRPAQAAYPDRPIKIARKRNRTRARIIHQQQIDDNLLALRDLPWFRSQHGAAHQSLDIHKIIHQRIA